VAEPALLGTAGRPARLVLEAGGRSWRLGPPGPEVTVQLRRPAGLAATLGGTSGLASAYASGAWECADLTGLVRWLLWSLRRPMRAVDALGRLIGPAVSYLAKGAGPTKAADRRRVRAHYDLPMVLFEAMLDETLTYSCAMFEDPGQALADAQRAKLDRVCSKLELGPRDHVVEIGSGWGSLAIHAASRYGCRITTTTVSESQLEVARARVERAGLSRLVTVVGEDYRDLGGAYDKLVSIEMVEAVDWRRHDAYFSSCQRLLRPDGLMLLQAIVMEEASYERAKLHRDFIRRQVFPGSCIPSVSALCSSLARATSLEVVGVEDIGCHYPLTLRRWRQNLEARWPDLQEAGLPAGLLRRWRLYLSYCEAAFLEGHISDVQMLLRRPRAAPGARAKGSR
jgi:cyclopropane-fatty-acyl-phospholipid synthase